MENTWIKLYRSLEDSDISEDAALLGVWIKILLRAQYKSKTKKIKRLRVNICAGQTHIVTREFAEELKIGHSKLRSCIKYLTATERISTQTSHNGTIITVCNWEKYQRDRRIPNTNNAQTEHRPNTYQHIPNTSTPITNTNSNGLGDPNKVIRKEGNKVITNINNTPQVLDEIPLPDPPSFHEEGFSGLELVPDLDLNNENLNDMTRNQDFPPSLLDQSSLALDAEFESGHKSTIKAKCGTKLDRETPPEKKKRTVKKWAVGDDYVLAKKWATWAKENFSHVKINAETWPEGLAKIRRVVELKNEVTGKMEKITSEQLAGVFEFAKNDDFWHKQIISPMRLLKRGSNDCRKIENIITKLKTKHCKYDKAMAHMAAIDRGEVQMGGGTIF